MLFIVGNELFEINTELCNVYIYTLAPSFIHILKCQASKGNHFSCNALYRFYVEYVDFSWL